MMELIKKFWQVINLRKQSMPHHAAPYDKLLIHLNLDDLLIFDEAAAIPGTRYLIDTPAQFRGHDTGTGTAINFESRLMTDKTPSDDELFIHLDLHGLLALMKAAEAAIEIGHLRCN